HWIQSKKAENDINFNKFIKKFFKLELTPVLFLHAFLESSSVEGIRLAGKNAVLIETTLVQAIKTKSYVDQKTFSITTLQLMSELFEFEHQLNLQKKEDGDDISLSLYRTFDVLDQIFELNYILDEIAPAEPKERLYEGAGVGVQSSYVTTLMALRYLNPAKNSRFVDLGSGYGRVGLVVGLMRPDIDFIGYEFVEGRVNIANNTSKNLGIDQHVHFHTQDLSAQDFQIPPADAYYIFDSFSDETYKHVLARLQEIALTKKMTVVTKGNARLWFKNANWSAPQEFNDGNLCLFRSR
ncbi:MAG: SAM-dependent methyltransferase, partial [Bdellovibrionaceae bacterium]|nr:SAM-dependent methyltransferase [Pseudobdellovibrionaceae bacterium]